MAWRPFRNFGLKLAALALGALLWYMVSGQQAERRVRVPLEFRKLPASMEIIGDAPDTVEVVIRGLSSQISRLELGDVVAFIDLTDARPGAEVFSLRPHQVIVPFGVEVTRVDPSEVTLSFDASGTATVPVAPNIEGTPAPGYVVGDVSVEPKEVAVVGPLSRVKALKSATTERISVEGKKATVTVTVAIGVSDGAVRLREARTARVTIHIVPGRPR